MKICPKDVSTSCECMFAHTSCMVDHYYDKGVTKNLNKDPIFGCEYICKIVLTFV